MATFNASEPCGEARAAFGKGRVAHIGAELQNPWPHQAEKVRFSFHMQHMQVWSLSWKIIA